MRITKRSREQCSRAYQGRHPAVWLLGAAVLLTAGSGGRADENDAALQLRAEKVAITVCGTCHGKTGTNTTIQSALLGSGEFFAQAN